MEGDISQLYGDASKLNALLANNSDPQLISRAKVLANQLFAHVKSSVEDYEDFIRRAERTEEFVLHTSAQVTTKERELKNYYFRATDLIDAIREAQERSRRNR